MSYQVLARKWRPRYFDEMVGQEHVLQALINALNEQRLHHAYLFTGTRGVGKTTIARILAKCLNCEQGVSAKPCGECDSCREIAEGRFVDLIEVDAASRTKVEDTRELLDNVQYAPTRGRYKVYLIDEVHMLSTHSFNALLKTLEEPPEHVKFLLATTDPQKLPITVLSRCLQFSLKNMTPERVVSYLQKVLEAESVPFEEPALWQLGRAAQGSMRDALSLTDQAIAYGQGSVGEDQVNAMLGTIDRGRVFKLAEVLATADVNSLLQEVSAMAEHGPDYDEVIQALMQLWHKVAVAQVAPSSVDNSQGDKDAIMQLAQAMRPEDLQLFYQTALVGRKDLPLAADPRQGFEMILLRMLAFRPVDSAPQNLDLQSSLQAPQSVSTVAVEATSVAQPIPAAESMTEAQPVLTADAGEAEQESAAKKPFNEGVDEAPLEPSSIGEDVAELDPQAEMSMAERLQSMPEPTPQVTETLVAETPAVAEEAFHFDLGQLSAITWWQWVKHLPLAGMPMAVALNSALIRVDGNRIEMDVDPDQGALFNDAQRQRIQQVLAEKLGVAIELEMLVQPPRGETPHQRRTRLLAEQMVNAEQAIVDDDNVQALMNEFGAHVVEGSILPLGAID
jgi:DNA polymerase-3 subunit gamma/tau